MEPNYQIPPICNAYKIILFTAVIGSLIAFVIYLSKETFVSFQDMRQMQNEQNRENELLGMIYEPIAGPLIPSYPTKRPFTAIYKNAPYVVNYNKSIPMCN